MGIRTDRVLFSYVVAAFLHINLYAIPLLSDANPQYYWWYMAAFHIPSWIGYYSLYLSAVKEPGTVPKDWLQRVSLPSAIELEKADAGQASSVTAVLPILESKGDGASAEARYCQKCEVFKPDRTHHCRKCGVCRTKMDHHCSWLNNCVAYENHKYFVVMCFWGWIAAIVKVTLTYKSWEYSNAVVFGVAMLLHVIFVIGTSALVFFHAYFVATNLTTLEYLERRRGKRERKHLNLYDLGLYNNLVEQLGPVHLWLLPVRTGIVGNGLVFPRRTESGAIVDIHGHTVGGHCHDGACRMPSSSHSAPSGGAAAADRV